MVVELLEFVGARLKERNPYVEAYAVNALRLSNGKVAKLSSKKDFEYVGISDLSKSGFYIRLNGKPKYSKRRARTSCGNDYDMFVPVRLVFYSTDTNFEGSRIENKFANDLRKLNFKDYKGNAGSPEFVIVQTNYDAISVFEEETGIKFASNERPVIVSIDANLRLIMAENDCNDFCNVYEILCGQTSPPAPNPGEEPMQTFCEAVENCPAVTSLAERVTALEQGETGELTCETLGDCEIIQQIQQSVTDEETSRQSADSNLQNEIDAEETARQNADTTLQNNIDAEAALRISGDATNAANLANHESDTNNPHNVTIEQARAENNQLAGNIDANGAQVDNLVNPSQPQQASTKSYTDAAEASAKAYADSLVVGVFRPAGDWDASGGTYPITGTGSGGAIRRGDTYRISVPGNIAGYDYDAGDSIYAIINAPGQLAVNWGDFEHNTQQATEGMRGTAAVGTQAEIEDENSTNDQDFVTPKKFWFGFAKGLTLSSFFSAVLGIILTGLTPLSGTITSSDSIFTAFRRIKYFIDNASSVLGLGNAAYKNVGTAAGTVAAGDDSRFVTIVTHEAQVVLNPLANTTYHIGAVGVPRITDTDRDSYWPITGTIIQAVIHQTNGSLNATAGNITYTFHNLSTSTDTTLGAAAATQGAQVTRSTVITGLNIPIIAGNFCTTQFDTPAWVTPPLGCSWTIVYTVKL